MNIMFVAENFVVDNMTEHSLYDWGKDYGIPLLGAIAIPLLVWYLTRFYGADKAEERKELKELRDNLNLLLSVCLDSIKGFIDLRARIIKVNEIEKDIKNKNTGKYSEKDIDLISQIIISPTYLYILTPSKYSQCIQYYENYIIDLLSIMSAEKIKNFKIDAYNEVIRNRSMPKNEVEKIRNINEIIRHNLCEYEETLTFIEKAIMSLKNFNDETKKLETKIKDLKLDNVKYTQEQQQVFKEIASKKNEKEANK